jgi:hypothetical protein
MQVRIMRVLVDETAMLVRMAVRFAVRIRRRMRVPMMQVMHMPVLMKEQFVCQSALKFNPLSASNRDPSLGLGQACPGSE